MPPYFQGQRSWFKAQKLPYNALVPQQQKTAKHNQTAGGLPDKAKHTVPSSTKGMLIRVNAATTTPNSET